MKVEKITAKSPGNLRCCVRRSRNSLKRCFVLVPLISCFLAFTSFMDPPDIRAQEQNNIIDGIISDTEYDLFTIFSDGIFYNR